MRENSHNTPNPSIGCSVNSCSYHSGSSQHCTLGEIQVGGTESHPKRTDETMCASFERGDGGSTM